jgi:hypothetical protein
MRRGYLLLTGITIAACFAAGCVSSPPATFVDGHERMPQFASLHLTADPAAPTAPMTITMTQPSDPDFERRHTFVPGVELQGDFPTSAGAYRLSAIEAGCSIDLILVPERQTDVVVRIAEDGACVFTRGPVHGAEITHAGDAVLVAPDNLPDPATKGGASPPSR